MTTKRLVFRHTVEGLFGVAFGDAITPALKEKLREKGLDLDRLAAAYPAEVYGAAFHLLREHVHPGVDEQTAGIAMGERFLEGYFSTVMGSLLKTILRVLPVQSVVERTPKSLETGTNFIKARVQPLGVRLYEVWMSDYSTSPAFLMGVVGRMVRIAGGKDVSVQLAKQEGSQLTFRLSWS